MGDNSQILKRNFSDLGVLQAPRTVLYSCDAQSDTAQNYAICVAEYHAQELCEQSRVLITANAAMASHVLLLLHENSVFPSMMRDVLLDLRGQGLIAMEG